jgi:hypothetical protein
MVPDSIVDSASGKVTSALPKEVLNSPDYNGQLTVLLVTITNDPLPVTTTTTTAVVNISSTPEPDQSTTQSTVSTTPVSLNYYACDS